MIRVLDSRDLLERNPSESVRNFYFTSQTLLGIFDDYFVEHFLIFVCLFVVVMFRLEAGVPPHARMGHRSRVFFAPSM